jgi:putative endopeptidase
MKLAYRVCMAIAVVCLWPLAGSTQSEQGAKGAGAGVTANVAVVAPADAGGGASGGSVEDAAGNCVDGSEQDSGTQSASGHGFDLTNLDRSAKPCSDFFQFAAGGWIKANPIPAEYPAWGNFNKLAQDNRDKMRLILEAAAKNTSAPEGSVEQKIGSFYASCMNEEAVEKAGVEPLKEEFAQIQKVSNATELREEIARLQELGVGVVFGFGSQPDFKDSTMQIGALGQGGLGLPDRDYYTRTDEKSKKLLSDYQAHVTKMFELLGDSPDVAAKEATTVFDLETKLAQASLPTVDQRNPDNIYHLTTEDQAKELTPHFDWVAYFHEMGQPTLAKFNVAEPDFFKEFDKLITDEPMDNWKIYLRWHLIHEAAPSLSSKFVDETFAFYGKTLTGAEKNQPRWKRCTIAADGYLGEALGQKYVEQYFPPSSKAAALEMVHNLMGALRADLQTLDWMGEETRKQAVIKLDAIQLKIGYPDKWRDYSSYKVDRGLYIWNVQRGEKFAENFQLSLIGKPTDRTLWGMTPPTVNAYYNPTVNEIVFPAGILQPPFYDPNRDQAMNYGGMGAVIGHEMTHGFDDQGSRFDEKGNLRNWWTDQDAKEFKARGDCVADQFNGFVVEEGLHENGKLVEGESIADLGGLTISLAAYRKMEEGKPAVGEIDGFTPEQRFFLGWAQIWAGSYRPEFARVIANTNPHPLPSFRVNGPLSNMPSFAKAYGCKDGDPMVRGEGKRCRIW